MQANSTDRRSDDRRRTGPLASAPGPIAIGHINDALRKLAPSWVRTSARAISAGDLDSLWPGERAAVAGAVPRRKAEFATGRALLRHLIGNDVEIGVGVDRRPLLPAGVTGTLAHDQDVAVAATTTQPTCRAIGIDVEPATVLPPEEAGLILRPDERHLDAHFVFVLKEAVYKAWSALGGDMLDHHDVAVTVDESGRDFTAAVCAAPPAFAGRYVTVEDKHFALVVVDAPEADPSPLR